VSAPLVPLTVQQALDAARAQGLDALDAQRLLLHVLDRSQAGRAWLIAHGGEALAPAAAQAFDAALRRRSAGEPLAYITGWREFHGLTLHVDARVLDPRPDTETLVDWALDVLRPTPGARVIDLGTGSGAIALAIRHARPDTCMHAVDASSEALAVARANAGRLGLSVQFSQGSWLSQAGGPFDLIVANPPYIASGDPHLAALTHEPLAALASGADGLADLRLIVAQAPAHLRPGGWLLLEHGWDQAAPTTALLAQAGFEDLATRHDLAGHGRCSGGRWPGTA